MIDQPRCPVCDAEDWHRIGTRTYRLHDAVTQAPYVSLRYRVIFEVWLPGAAELKLTSEVCRRCGFVLYAPRPSAEDIDNKYRFLASVEGGKQERAAILDSDLRRSRELHDALAPYLAKLPQRLEILDFGGGNGRLMPAFIARGHACGVVDYPTEIISGVQFLGASLDALAADARFDLIVCSHVLEHLADPKAAVLRLIPRLRDAGVLYVEVPLEIWGSPPLPAEPVTHINFFTPDSLRALLEHAGLEVQSCAEDLYTTEMGSRGIAVRAVATRGSGDAAGQRSGDSFARTLALVSPNRWARVRRAVRYPELARRQAVSTLQRKLPRRFFWRLFK